MAEKDFYEAIYELKDKLQLKGLTDPQTLYLVNNNFNLTLAQILSFRPNSSDLDVNLFYSCLTVHRLYEEAPIGPQSYDYLPYFDYICSFNPQFKDSFAFKFTSWLVKEITNQESIDVILNIAEGIFNIQNKNLLTDAMDTIYVYFMTFAYDQLDMVVSPRSPDEIIAYLARFKRGQAVGVDVSALIIPIINSVCSYIETTNGLDVISESQIINKDFNKAREITFCMKSLTIDEENLNRRIRQIENFIGDCSPIFESTDDTNWYQSKIPKTFVNSHLLSNLSTLQFKGFLTGNANPGERFGVAIYKYYHPDIGDVAVKEYTANVDKRDLDKFNSEIEVLEKLSALAAPNNCFLKYYGKWLNENKLYIIMEYHEYDLMNYISRQKHRGARFSEETLKNMAIKLLNSFALMEGCGIFHKDIKPHNLLVTKDEDLKIIDFSISEIKPTIEATITTNSITIQGTKGYAAPEIQDALEKGLRTANINIAKADVFSLGLTLLQIILMEELATYNQSKNNQLLMQKVELVPIFWMKNILKRMVCLDYHQRLSFRKLMMEIPGFNTIV